MQMKFLSWNLAGRVKKLDAQLSAIFKTSSDILALQEVTPNTLKLLVPGLRDIGFGHIINSIERYPTVSFQGPRKYGVIIASRWPLACDLNEHNSVPWPERLLSCICDSPYGQIEVHTTHIPPGSTNGWTKVDMLQGIYDALAKHTNIPRVLCGDFNTPQRELISGDVVTWAQGIKSNGSVILKRNHERWDVGERCILKGLSHFDLPDVYRSVHGYEIQEFSWYWQGKGKSIGRRYDHIFASKCLNATRCHYLHEYREDKLSDHAPILAAFNPA